jgi:high-affinity iron transporter
MVFTLAIIFASDRQAASPVHGKLLLLGAALGLAVALGVALAIFKLGAKLNMRRFFRVIGVLLMVFAAGLLADAIENMQQLHWLDFGRHVLWNTSGTVSEASSFGDVLHSLLGYADRPTVLQAFVWLTYVVVSTICFIRLGRRGAHHGHKEHAHRADRHSDAHLESSPKGETIVP